MERRGEDPDTFANLVFTGGHDASLDAVMAGELDAAVIDSVVRTRRSRSDPDVGSLHLIDRLGPWPVQPLVARSTMNADQLAANNDPAMQAELEAAMQAELEAAALTGFIAVDANHYESVRHAMTSAR